MKRTYFGGVSSASKFNFAYKLSKIGGKNRLIDQFNRVESSEESSHKYIQLISDSREKNKNLQMCFWNLQGSNGQTDINRLWTGEEGRRG